MSVDLATAPARSESLLALRNALKLMGSLLVTWGIALGVRLLLPRFLGPDSFGVINFADALTSTVFVLLGLGLDTYIRKEVSVRPGHASDFLGGVTAVRLLGAVVLFAGIQVFLSITHRPPETWAVVHLYGAGAVLLVLNQSFAALLHSRGTVDGLSVLNVAAKVVWGASTVAALALGWPLWTVALAIVLAELTKLVGSVALVRRNLDVSFRVNVRATALAIGSSLPIFLNVAGHTIYSKLDVSLLAVVASDREVAWYGAASLLAGVALMVTPMLSWVLMPLFARARARSDEEYTQVMRRSLELVLVIAFPTTLFMALGAPEWVALLYGAEYGPTVPSLQVLSSLFVLTYVAILSSNALILTGRAWTQAAISLSGLLFNPLLNALTIPWGMRSFGPGGAGVGAAVAQLGTEILVTGLMMGLVARRAFDRRSLGMIARTVVVCVAVVAVDRALAGVNPVGRLAADAAAYLALVIASGAVRPRETLRFARELVASRRAGRAGDAASAGGTP